MTTWIAALVVEDEALVRFDLTQSLQAEGYETFEAADAAEAIGVMEAHPEIRVVFTDIQMPGTMDGLALSHYVRKRWPPTNFAEAWRDVDLCAGRGSGSTASSKPRTLNVNLSGDHTYDDCL